MIARSVGIAALCLSAALAGTSALAQTPPPAAPQAAGPAGHGHWMAHRHSAFHYALRHLDLTAEQQTQIKAIHSQTVTAMRAKFSDARTNHESLMSASPNDSNYPALLAAEKSNAATRIQAMSDAKAQIYAVLTPEQQSKIPQLMAQYKAERQAKMAAWRAKQAGQANQTDQRTD